MSARAIVILSIACFVVGIGTGRYATPTKVVTKTVVQTKEELKDNSTVTRTTDTKPGGEILTTVTIHHHFDETEQKSHESDKIVEHAAPRWTISGLVGLSLRSAAPMYGASVNYRILGPIGIGAFGLVPSSALGGNSPLGGLSVSVSF
jgi:hypothetical protein